MRTAGIAFVAATICAVLAPWPLGLLLVLGVAVASIVSWVTAAADRRRYARSEKQLRETVTTVDWLRQMGQPSADEPAWEDLYSSTHRTIWGHELARPRSVEIPAQRLGSEAS